MAAVGALDALRAGGAMGFEGASDTRKASIEKEQFLKLLVAQIGNQDPLNPQDSDQYMQQLTQFSTLEQLMNLNRGVDTLAVGQLSANSQSAIRFVGKEVLATGSDLSLDESNQPSMNFAVSDPSVEKVTVNVRDDSGEVIYTQEVTVAANGRGEFTWNGTDMNGRRMVPGRYKVEVEAEGENGAVGVDTYVRGTVTGVRFDQGYPELMVGDRRLKLSDVLEVSGE